MEENKIVEEKDIEEVENGTEGIKISSDVIAVIAGVAVSEVPGVFGMAGGFAGGITEVLKGKKNLAKGIKVDTTDNKAKIDVNIIVDYGARIPDVAFEIQNRVKTAVENMTGLKVEEVNVHVQGVNTESLTEESKKENITEEDAKKLVEYLRKNNLGRASFLPIASVKGKKLEKLKGNESGVIGIASDLVKFNKKYEQIILNLLGRTVIVDNMNTAIKVAAMS